MDIKSKIKKLLKLAAGTNFADEAAAATAKAHRLAQEHKIELAFLGELEEDAEHIDPEAFLQGKKVASWKASLAVVIAESCGTFVYWSRDRKNKTTRINISGKPRNIEQTREFYAHAVKLVDKLAAKHAAGKGRSYVTAYRVGVVAGFAKALEEEREALKQALAGTNKERALMVVQNETDRAKAVVTKQVGRLRSGRTQRVGDGFSQGKRDGYDNCPRNSRVEM